MKRSLLIATALIAAPSLAQAAPYLPVYGSPNSVQAQILHSGLEMDSVQEESDARFDVEGDSDTIGGTITHWDSMGVTGERYEGRYQKAWRPFEGSRSRLLVDVPVNVLSTDGETALQAVVSIGLEVPVAPNWSLTPRVAYGLVSADDYYGGDGEIASASVTSRYRFPQVGRGDLVIGNMIGYTSTVDTGLVNPTFAGEADNWTLRNGLAYQFPIKTMIMGRQASARISATHTQIEGDTVFLDSFSEVAVSFGVRGREGSMRNSFEAIRFGFIYTFADDYGSGTLTFGYRF